MPTLSMFYGIIIRMQSEKGGKHHVPHIHCLYGDDEIVMSLDGEVLEGSIPANKKLFQRNHCCIQTGSLRRIRRAQLCGRVP